MSQETVNSDYFDSFMNPENMFKEESDTTSEIDIKDSIKIDLENPGVSASSLLDFFNQLQDLSNPVVSMEDITEEPLSEEVFITVENERQKKDTHNQIERRRRFNINDRIKDLGALLPNQKEPFHNIVKIVRQNKGSILKATVEYVKILKNEQVQKKKMEDKCKIQEFQNRKLLLLLQEYEKKMAVYGVPVQSVDTKGIPAVSQILEDGSFLNIQEDIKTELLDSDQGIFQLENYEEDHQKISLSDPMLSSVPLEYHNSSSHSSSNDSSPCSSLDSFDIMDLDF